MENLFQDEPADKRKELLHANARSVSTEQVKRFFTAEEMSKMRVDVSDLSIEKSDKEEELKTLSAGLKGEIKVLASEIKTNLKMIRQKFDLVEEEVYYFDDQDKGMMYTFNQYGEIISSRKLFPEERQASILSINQTKTA